ncbi:MAG: hypothetical protein AB8H86_17610 [Polyangiales bacterium]
MLSRIFPILLLVACLPEFDPGLLDADLRDAASPDTSADSDVGGDVGHDVGDDVSEPVDAATDATDATDAGPAPFTFRPSNLSAELFMEAETLFEDASPLVVSADEVLVLDSDNGTAWLYPSLAAATLGETRAGVTPPRDGAEEQSVATIRTSQDVIDGTTQNAPDIRFFLLTSLTIEANGLVLGVGTLALGIGARDQIEVAGHLSVGAAVLGLPLPRPGAINDTGWQGAGNVPPTLNAGFGPSPGGSGGSFGLPGGEGGGGGGKGQPDYAGAPSGVTYGNENLEPLVGGALGGSAGLPCEFEGQEELGLGGGALQLFAPLLRVSGFITAGGGGGRTGYEYYDGQCQAANDYSGGGVGGGSGGALLLEADTVNVTGILSVAGGGGSRGGRGTGRDAPQSGLRGDESGGGTGGGRQPGAVADGTAGRGGDGGGVVAAGAGEELGNGGGGGGGGGRIRINSRTSDVAPGALIPRSGTAAASAGALHPR